jgi:hypothetical protein
MNWWEVIPPPSTVTVDDKRKPQCVLYDASGKPLSRPVPKIGFHEVKPE